MSKADVIEIEGVVAAPADAHPSAAENVAEDRGADADRAGPAG